MYFKVTTLPVWFSQALFHLIIVKILTLFAFIRGVYMLLHWLIKVQQCLILITLLIQLHTNSENISNEKWSNLYFY